MPKEFRILFCFEPKLQMSDFDAKQMQIPWRHSNYEIAYAKLSDFKNKEKVRMKKKHLQKPSYWIERFLPITKCNTEVTDDTPIDRALYTRRPSLNKANASHWKIREHPGTHTLTNTHTHTHSLSLTYSLSPPIQTNKTLEQARAHTHIYNNIHFIHLSKPTQHWITHTLSHTHWW